VGNFLQLDLAGETQLLSMLIDPRAAVHAETGIIPITTLALPDHFLEDVLQAMDVTFRAGPVLTEVIDGAQKSISGQNVAAAIQYLQPAENRKDWSWVELNNPTPNVSWDSYSIQGADQTARLSTVPQSLRDGWMKLKLQNTEQD
jgi:hypothetical protein